MTLEQHLKTFFGFDAFMAGQKTVIEKILDGRSAAAIFPTGAGKSLCYQLPAMLLPGMTLVVSPLLSLMKDQLDFLQQKKIPAARLDSTLERPAYNAVVGQAQKGALKILMISVERFRNERFRFHLGKMNISLMVIDEAHCISEWGHNFRPEYLKLPDYRAEFNIGQTLLLTATATGKVIDDMCARFGLFREDVCATGFYRSNLHLQVSPVAASDKAQHLLQSIREQKDAATIVYVTQQKTAEKVAEFLRQKGIDAQPYHAGMRTVDRERVQNAFMGGRVSCVVATIAFGMGIDKQDIRRIIHYDLPKSIENYSQEIGRSGRDGKRAWCEVLANRDNMHVLENFIFGDTPEESGIRQLLEGIKAGKNAFWEVKMVPLSNELNIRMLPLKTLLVYLSMENVIRPRLTYFEEYTFKFLEEPGTIIGFFQGERQRFVTALMANCITKKVWTAVDIPAIFKTYGADRKRVVSALEYFEEKGWIELQSRQSVDVYDIVHRNFDCGDLARKMQALFKEKERHEIQRIHTMADFFESDACLSVQLAGYFGEHLEMQKCGHCSVCRGEKAVLQHTLALKPLSGFDGDALTREFVQAAGDQARARNVAKFLCGIHTPVFSKLKVKAMRHFGTLDRYPFPEVMAWVSGKAFTRRQQ